MEFTIHPCFRPSPYQSTESILHDIVRSCFQFWRRWIECVAWRENRPSAFGAICWNCMCAKQCLQLYGNLQQERLDDITNLSSSSVWMCTSIQVPIPIPVQIQSRSNSNPNSDLNLRSNPSSHPSSSSPSSNPFSRSNCNPTRSDPSLNQSSLYVPIPVQIRLIVDQVTTQVSILIWIHLVLDQVATQALIQAQIHLVDTKSQPKLSPQFKSV